MALVVSCPKPRRECVFVNNCKTGGGGTRNAYQAHQIIRSQLSLIKMRLMREREREREGGRERER